MDAIRQLLSREVIATNEAKQFFVRGKLTRLHEEAYDEQFCVEGSIPDHAIFTPAEVTEIHGSALPIIVLR